ncbi:MAG: metallophosphoesterase [bacterium]|nr:metallophosphoesterase [bacterium]
MQNKRKIVVSREQMKSKTRKKISITGIVMIAMAIFVWWGNNAIQVNHIIFTEEKIPAVFDGYRIVQISDLHNKEFGKQQERLLQVIESQEPDIIVVTGDLIDSNHTDVETAMNLVQGMVKISPVYYVSGNHEKWSGVYEELKEQLQQAKVTILEDEKTLLSKGNDVIDLIGLQDVSFLEETNREVDTVVETTIKRMRQHKDTFQLVLSHRPELLEAYAESKADLVLAGHAHGGQFRIPFLGGVAAPDQGLFPKLTAGVHKKEDTTLVISRGLGNSIIPMRIFNRPEVIVLTLQSHESTIN